MRQSEGAVELIDLLSDGMWKQRSTRYPRTRFFLSLRVASSSDAAADAAAVAAAFISKDTSTRDERMCATSAEGWGRTKKRNDPEIVTQRPKHATIHRERSTVI